MEWLAQPHAVPRSAFEQLLGSRMLSKAKSVPEAGRPSAFAMRMRTLHHSPGSPSTQLDSAEKRARMSALWPCGTVTVVVAPGRVANACEVVSAAVSPRTTFTCTTGPPPFPLVVPIAGIAQARAPTSAAATPISHFRFPVIPSFLLLR